MALTPEERTRIRTLYAVGMSQTQIARTVGRCRPTVRAVLAASAGDEKADALGCQGALAGLPEGAEKDELAAVLGALGAVAAVVRVGVRRAAWAPHRRQTKGGAERHARMRRHDEACDRLLVT